MRDPINTSDDATTATAAQIEAQLAARGSIRDSDLNGPSFRDAAVLGRAKVLLAARGGKDLPFEVLRNTGKGGRWSETLALKPKVGMGATHLAYTDRHPYEVTRVVSAKCLEVRPMKATGGLKKDAVFIPGGFVGHVVEQHSAQEWKLESDPTAAVTRIRLGKNGWKGDVGPFAVGYAHKFHDFNF